MNNQEIRAALERHWEATVAVALDLDRAHDIYNDDLIVEFPQSGERILYNLQVWNQGLFPSWGHITYELIYSILIFRRMIHKWLLKPSTRILIELI